MKASAWLAAAAPGGLLVALAAAATPTVASNPQREAYFGDLHLHTSYSLDAYLLGAAKVDPDLAYRFARGEAITYLNQRVQRREPLDFLAVTDHAENIGVLNQLDDPDSAMARSAEGQRLLQMFRTITTAENPRDFAALKTPPDELDPVDALWRDYVGATHNKLPAQWQSIPADAWAREVDFANHNNRPGTFTAFIAYEWTSAPAAANLHRNVIFRGNAAPAPFTAFDSRNPEDLWTWLESIRTQGFEALAIPHNGNASNGLMYDWVTAIEYMDRAYAQHRQANEPLSEIAQNKGASETHPLLSPNDEFADYQIFDFLEGYRRQVGRVQGSYLRDAVGAGLVLERKLGVNPFKYGFVGGSDLHSGLSVSAQADYAGSHWRVNLGGGKPSKDQLARRFSEPAAAGEDLQLKTGPGNLTGIWAESNTRESLYDALRRRETFATSGSRMKFRLFAGWQLPKDLMRRPDWVALGYRHGVPMGGDLPAAPRGVRAPSFAIWASKDPNGANLDRVQVIKVWEDAGQQHEQVFDVAWSGQRAMDRATGKLPAVGDTVDAASGRYSNAIGATALSVLWQDPQFDARRAAAYYLRVLEIPTPRWSTLLASEHGLPPPAGAPVAQQLRGWSSPIWYRPPAP